MSNATIGPLWMLIGHLFVISGGLVTAVKGDTLLYAIIGSAVSLAGVLSAQRFAYLRGYDDGYDDSDFWNGENNK